MIEAHLHRRDTDDLAAIADRLRIGEAGLAAGRADAVEAPRAALDRIAHVWTIAEIHPDEARLLVPVARREDAPPWIENIEHRAARLRVDLGQVEVHGLLQHRVLRIACERDDFAP